MATRKQQEADFDKPFDEQTESDIELAQQANQVLDLKGQGEQVEYIPVDFEDAIRHLEETGEIVYFEGSPWHIVDKDLLCDEPFIIMGYRVNEGSFGMFVSLMAVTKNELPDKQGKRVNKVVINDGSTGIKDQVILMLQSGRSLKGVLCENGLRKSEYEWEDPTDGRMKPAVTYYIG